MKPDERFLKQPKSFWACVRSLSQEVGYSKAGEVLIPSLDAMVKAFVDLELDPTAILAPPGQPTTLGVLLYDYFAYRAEVLTTKVEPKLMDQYRAEAEFQKLHQRLQPRCPIPMNKQKGVKKAHSFLTGIINMLIEQNCEGLPCDYDPRRLTTVTKDGRPVRTLARRVDGAFPYSTNPIAIWEIKEYYYTTTFGSRVAGGVYETLLDGLELEELKEHEQIDVKHYLMIDAHLTWWDMGKPYLCRMIDMLHMGSVDEILFGSEVLEEMPRIVKEWVALYRQGAAADHGGENLTNIP